MIDLTLIQRRWITSVQCRTLQGADADSDHSYSGYYDYETEAQISDRRFCGRTEETTVSRDRYICSAYGKSVEEKLNAAAEEDIHKEAERLVNDMVEACEETVACQKQRRAKRNRLHTKHCS